MSRTKTTSIVSEDNIYGEYFKNTRENKQKYGENTIVLMQVGSFLEIYGIKNSQGQITESLIQEFADLCQFNIAEKKNGFGEKGQIVMAGFMVYLLDKYLPRMLDGGYTVAVYLQEKAKDGKSFNRVLNKVFSPGTFVSCDTDSSQQLTNNIMSIWFHLSKPMLTSQISKIRDTMICGISVINIFTGKSYIFEYQCPYLLNNTTFDELERAVSVFQPSEVLIISPFERKDINKIVQYSGISTSSIHCYNTTDVDNVKIVNCENQKYIKQILTTFYNEDVYDVVNEFNENIIATQAFSFLLDFIQEHNRDLVKNIALPIFNNTSDRLVLANHTLVQLNIIDDGNKQKMGQYNSVLSFVNKCCTAIGKRKLQYQVTNPTSNEVWLRKEYDVIDEMLESNNYAMVENIRSLLTQMRDIEKICRQIVLKKIYPSSIANLHKSIVMILGVQKLVDDNNKISMYLCDEFSNQSSLKGVESIAKDILFFLDDVFIIDICKKTQSMTNFDENFIQKGVSESLDKAIVEYDTSVRIFHKVRENLNQMIQLQEKVTDTEFVKIHETDKSGSSLQITSKRSLILKGILEKNYDGVMEVESTFLKWKDFKFSKASSSAANMEIDHPILHNISRNMLKCKEQINQLIAETYLNILTKLENNWFNDLENLVNYIGKVDVLQCKVYLAKNYNYCKPEIDSDFENAYVSAYDLRHCLIEHLQQNELYVTNDITLGKDENKGILLYGTNAVGKTSLIRALGISVILAQAGMFVPCSRFVYKPYTAIYSRILGNDNIFKGLSTFAVEMSELRVLLKMSDKDSLILGDELCSGTESESALSIFVAGLMKLCEKKASFIFATHFHEIVQYSEIAEMNELSMKHLAVSYDRANECLIYDRKLKEGSGPRTYGLEVCKSLYLEEDFMELAYSIRNKYYPESRGELSNKTTVYNAKKIRGICEICNETMGVEIHHLSPQQCADDDGFIGSFHKDHKANLVSICEECHDRIHREEKEHGVEKKIVKKKTTKGYKLVSI
jgi:DNA mismatch repair protein MutS